MANNITLSINPTLLHTQLANLYIHSNHQFFPNPKLSTTIDLLCTLGE